MQTGVRIAIRSVFGWSGPRNRFPYDEVEVFDQMTTDKMNEFDQQNAILRNAELNTAMKQVIELEASNVRMLSSSALANFQMSKS